ncbi:MAG: hypothetical protein K2H46_03895 [Muribaculaceae bacterium]|nr:hypothetical protein [Muribaculaceae bacterium]
MTTFDYTAALASALDRVNESTSRRVSALRGCIRSRAFANLYNMCMANYTPSRLDRLEAAETYKAFE